MNDHYKNLGLSPGASQDEIKKAFRKLAHIHHPDKGGDAAKFKVISESYTFLIKNLGGSYFTDVHYEAAPRYHQDYPHQEWNHQSRTYEWKTQSGEDFFAKWKQRVNEDFFNEFSSYNWNAKMNDNFYNAYTRPDAAEAVRQTEVDLEIAKKRMRDVEDWIRRMSGL